jgi:hypothetical protein
VLEATVDLVSFRGDEEVDSFVLLAKLLVEAVLEATKGRLLVARDCDGRGLVPACVNLDLMLERVVVEVICCKDDVSEARPPLRLEWKESMSTYEDSILGPTR